MAALWCWHLFSNSFSADFHYCQRFNLDYFRCKKRYLVCTIRILADVHDQSALLVAPVVKGRIQNKYHSCCLISVLCLPGNNFRGTCVWPLVPETSTRLNGVSLLIFFFTFPWYNRYIYFYLKSINDHNDNYRQNCITSGHSILSGQWLKSQNLFPCLVTIYCKLGQGRATTESFRHF